MHPSRSVTMFPSRNAMTFRRGNARPWRRKNARQFQGLSAPKLPTDSVAASPSKNAQMSLSSSVSRFQRLIVRCSADNLAPRFPQGTVTDGNKKDIELKHDNLLRKFEYSKALDAVLKPYVARKKPEYTYSLLMELVRREGLTRAVAGRDEKQLCLLLQFLNRYISDNRFSRLCIHVSNILIDLYLPHHGMTSRVDNLFKEMLRKLDKEVNYLETLMELTGAVDVVLTSAFNKQMDKPFPVIEHRVCSLPS